MKPQLLSQLIDNGPETDELNYGNEIDILNRQIKNPQSKNIAIVAPYGAGKSSVIQTYLDKYRRSAFNKIINRKKYKKCEKISLSSFNDVNYEDNEIERSILQQLLYTRTQNQLPNSKIRRTNQTNSVLTILKSLIVTLFFFCSAYLLLDLANVQVFSKTGIDILIKLKNINLCIPVNFRMASIILSLISFFLITMYVIHRCKIIKVKYKDIEIETKKNDHENKGEDNNSLKGSLINEFLDEVLYYFECTKTNLIIFEDIDRIPNSKKIFVKLRELNTLVNNSHTVSKKVTFLYAIKDNIFENAEQRAKFFEYILPVVPVVTPVTIVEKIRSYNDKFSEAEPNLKLDLKFIKGISQYMPDMRIIKNVFDDYAFMWSKLCTKNNNVTIRSGFDNKVLFSLTMYKALFPNDYSLLLENKGFIPLIFNKDNLIKDEVKIINDNIESINKEIEEIKNQKVDLEDLKLMLRGRLAEKNYAQTYTGQKTIKIEDIESFKDLTPKMIQHPRVDAYGRTCGYAIPGDVLPEASKGKSFYQREQDILVNNEKQISLLNNKIEKLKEKEVEYKNKSCVEIIRSEGVKKYFERIHDSLKENYEQIVTDCKNFEEQCDYLEFLIFNEYISDNYIEYTAKYDSSYISYEDMKFIKLIKRGENCFDKKLENVSQVIDELEDNDFSNIYVLNKEILDEMSYIRTKYPEKFLNIINVFKSDNDFVYECFIRFIQLSNENSIIDFIKILCENNVIISSKVYDDQIDERKKFVIIKTILENVDSVSAYNSNNSITNFISNYELYINLFKEIEENKAKQLLEELNPKFNLLYLPSEQDTEKYKNIYKYIIDKDMYKINLRNLRTIFNEDIEQYENFMSNNYEFIMNSSKKKVSNYIEKNINDYCLNVLLEDGVGVDKKTTKFLIENEEISFELRKKMCIKFKEKFEKINELEEKEVNELIGLDLIVLHNENMKYVIQVIGDDLQVATEHMCNMNVDTKLKKALFKIFENQFDVVNNQEVFYKFIVDNRVQINSNTIWKFTSYADKDLTLLSLGMNSINKTDQTQLDLKKFILSVNQSYENLYNGNGYKISPDSEEYGLFWGLYEKGFIEFWRKVKSKNLFNIKMYIIE